MVSQCSVKLVVVVVVVVVVENFFEGGFFFGDSVFVMGSMIEVPWFVCWLYRSVAESLLWSNGRLGWFCVV
jgi:hypothetical protein